MKVNVNIQRKSVSLAAFVIALAGLPAAALTLKDGLVTYMPFDDGTVANTVSGSPVAPEASTATAPTFEGNGMVGKCLNIPRGAYVKLTGSDSETLAKNSLGFGDSGKSFTAIVWANHGTLSGDPVIFGNKNWGGIAKGALLCAKTVNNKSTVQFNAANGSARIDYIATEMQFAAEASGKWTFYAMVCDNGTFYCYQGKSDGTFGVKTKSLSNFTMDTGYPFVLGQQGDCAYGKIFAGQLDDFALWNRALSGDDVRRIYEYGRSGMELGDVLDIDSNDDPTMEVAKIADDRYVFTFGGRRNGSHALCIATATNDGGEDKYAWDAFEKVIDVPADMDTYTYAVPMSFFETNRRFRFFLMQTDDLPYAKEVEYAHSDGKAWIDTGIAPRRDLVSEFDIRLTANNTEWGTGKTDAQTTIYENMFGAFAGNDKRGNYGMCRCLASDDDRNLKWDREYSGYEKALESVRAYQFVGSCINDTDYHVVFSTTNLVVDGTEYGSGISLNDFIEGGYCIALYRNLKNGAIYDDTMIGYYKTFSLYTSKCRVRDYVPVEDSEGKVGLFDRVTGRFVSSAGTALTAGSDLDAVRKGWVRCVSAPYLASSTIPATASYTGNGHDPLDLTDWANWACTNGFGFALSFALPTADTVLTVSGTTAFAVPQGTTFACKSIRFANAVFADGADLRGLDFSKVTSDSVIDLQGRTLFLADETTVSLGEFTVTDTSSGEPGMVCISVSAGTTLENAGMSLTGNLKLRKEGAGTFSAAKASQTYAGGTDVLNGTIRVDQSGSGHLGTGAVTVSRDGVFDMNGMDVSSVTTVLAGGTLQNSSSGSATLPKTLTLTADSRVVHANASSSKNDMTVPDQCNWNLGGKTLSISMTGNDSDFNFTQNGPNVVSNGTISVTVGTASGTTKGYFAIRQISGRDGLKLDLGNSYLRLQSGSGNSSVMDFTANPVGDVYSYKYGSIWNRLEVYGTFVPKKATGFNMTMMDGSTLDLSQWSGVYDCAFPGNSYNKNAGNDTSCTLQFAADATVRVNLAGRDDLKTIAKSERPYVVKWAANATPAGTTTFVLDAETQKRGFSCKVTDTGLELLLPKGFAVIVK